jgi:isoprenylcysteine carboxyl methyltransferase (ICMT) family protein YpbQ
MNPYRWIIAGLWLLFVLYWGIAAVGIKRSAGGPRWIGLRIALILLIIALLQFRALRRVLAEAQRLVGNSHVLGVIGVALCLLGFALAFSARYHLGRNWGPPMSRKEQPELITSGPYAFIRHPIYAGLILAMLGSAIAVSLLWVLLLVLAGAYFIYSARREEALMARLFPEQYPAYRARTGMLMPRLLPRR